MKLHIGVLVLLVATSGAAATEDPELRREAAELMERANAASLSPNLPNLERIDSFRVLDASSGVREGTFTRVVVQGAGRRDETKFGDYHVVDVWTHGKLATVRTSELPPAAVETLSDITPLQHLRFDATDVIRAIVDRAADGKSLRCIEFETIKGERVESNNEVCVDAGNGTFVTQKTGDELVEYGEYFPFAGAMMPGKIAYSEGGVRKLEVTQTMSEFAGTDSDVLAAPPDAQLRRLCTTFRRAIGVSMPQPKVGNGGRDTDVVVRGIIGTDGRVREAVVQSAGKADLGAEALGLVQQWVFTPAMCNGNPNPDEASFVVHFHGR